MINSGKFPGNTVKQINQFRKYSTVTFKKPVMWNLSICI